MEDPAFPRLLKWIVAYLVCIPALLMPYRVRLAYTKGIAALIHSPFRIFGKIARFLLAELRIAPTLTSISPAPFAFPPPEPAQSRSIVILFSGGTDSTCAAARAAHTHSAVHLLTFYEHATRFSPVPEGNVSLLRAAFPSVSFTHTLLSVDALVRFFSYQKYFRTIRTYGLLALATPGFSTLSWHTRAIAYCLDNNITEVADGLTRELMHFPGHMDATVQEIRKLYARFGITYTNPVREWPTPRDQQFIDKVLVNRHEEFLFVSGEEEERRTTGHYLYSLGIFPTPNIKGSSLDRSMQHDCYPFALYNILAFWGRLTFEPYEIFCDKIVHIMREKIEEGAALLDAYRAHDQAVTRFFTNER